MHRRQKLWTAKLWRYVETIGGNLAFVALAGAVLLTVAGVALASRHLPLTQASGTGGSQLRSANAQYTPRPDTCGAPALPACHVPGARIPLASQSPSDIIAAARKSTLFTVDRSGNGDYVKDLSRLGIPQLIQALHMPGKASAPDYYDIPIFDGTGATIAVAQLQLDAAHTSIIVAAITTYAQPLPHDTLTHMSSAAAVSAVQARRHIGLQTGRQPRLVYFPGDRAAEATGKITWVAGGQMPYDPIWAVPGADGKDYIVGDDGQVYTLDQLPLVDG
jgi:hypothetical protein